MTEALKITPINPFKAGSLHQYSFPKIIFTITQKVIKILDSSLWHKKAMILNFKVQQTRCRYLCTLSYHINRRDGCEGVNTTSDRI